MRVVTDYPPLYDEIMRAFPAARGQAVLFAWGDTIFNPRDVRIPPQLMAHEEVHGVRQGNDLGDIVSWWRRYMDDPNFRLAEELPAHFAEYAYLAENAPNRNQRRSALKIVAKRLAAPLYGRMVTTARAAELLRELDKVAA